MKVETFSSSKVEDFDEQLNNFLEKIEEDGESRVDRIEFVPDEDYYVAHVIYSPLRKKGKQ